VGRMAGEHEEAAHEALVFWFQADFFHRWEPPDEECPRARARVAEAFGMSRNGGRMLRLATPRPHPREPPGRKNASTVTMFMWNSTAG
jgi:hypothetical protein